MFRQVGYVSMRHGSHTLRFLPAGGRLAVSSRWTKTKTMLKRSAEVIYSVEGAAVGVL